VSTLPVAEGSNTPAVAPSDEESAGVTPAADDGLFPAPAPPPPHTADPVVDRALVDLHQALSLDLDHQIEVANTVGEALQARLQDLASE